MTIEYRLFSIITIVYIITIIIITLFILQIKKSIYW